ncbi:unnamed protein product [Allacma fusca]|uniref:Uncharacterized protein n=1 Tax=Allacma fusca TaxID=39272 RepID=A0A8J2PWK8_9HEXA|nr:unnamed protein product [Allacma fusca]
MRFLTIRSFVFLFLCTILIASFTSGQELTWAEKITRCVGYEKRSTCLKDPNCEWSKRSVSCSFVTSYSGQEIPVVRNVTSCAGRKSNSVDKFSE